MRFSGVVGMLPCAISDVFNTLRRPEVFVFAIEVGGNYLRPGSVSFWQLVLLIGAKTSETTLQEHYNNNQGCDDRM